MKKPGDLRSDLPADYDHPKTLNYCPTRVDDQKLMFRRVTDHFKMHHLKLWSILGHVASKGQPMNTRRAGGSAFLGGVPGAWAGLVD